MDGQEIEAIVGGYHGDAFRVLGPHALKSGWEVRAFSPDADSVAVQVGKAKPVPMIKRHPAGFFTVELPGDISSYCLQVARNGQKPETIEDSYRFPPLLTEYEIHLHAEGTNFESYETLGAHLKTIEGVDGSSFRSLGPECDQRRGFGRF